MPKLEAQVLRAGTGKRELILLGYRRGSVRWEGRRKQKNGPIKSLSKAKQGHLSGCTVCSVLG
jgi:hypothetical protein